MLETFPGFDAGSGSAITPVRITISDVGPVPGLTPQRLAFTLSGLSATRTVDNTYSRTKVGAPGRLGPIVRSGASLAHNFQNATSREPDRTAIVVR